MEKYFLNVDKSNNKISWVYNNKEYSVEINGLKLATIDEEEHIFIENRSENNEKQVQYYKLNGEFLFTSIEKTGSICWKNGSKKINLSIDELQDSNIYENYNIIITLKGVKDTERKLSIYSMNGQLICEQEEPENYYFSYLTNDGDKPAVICDGNGKKGSRKNGRSTWKFSINPVTGELVRISVAY